MINYDLIEDTLCAIEDQTFTISDDRVPEGGSILVFLPGIGEIRTLCDRLSGGRTFGDQSKYLIIPLHSNLSASDQRRAFQASPKGTRKIIVSTNIAETR